MKKLIAVALFLFAVPAHAVLVTYSFSGFVESFHDTFPGVIQGQSFFGSFTYDSNTPQSSFSEYDDNGVSPTQAARYDNAIKSFSISTNGNTFSVHNNSINGIGIVRNVHDDFPVSFWAGVRGSYTGYPNDIGMNFTANSGWHMLDNVDLNTFDPDFSDPRWNSFSFYMQSSDNRYAMRGHIDNISRSESSPVPEPMTLASLGIGLVGLGIRKYRRSK